jgi:hypothetical protein
MADVKLLLAVPRMRHNQKVLARTSPLGQPLSIVP